MDKQEETETAVTIAVEPGPYSSLKQVIEEEASRDAAQQDVDAQERARTRIFSQQGISSTPRESARYGLD